MNFGLRVAVTAALLLSGVAFADSAPPPVVLADNPQTGSGLPGESFRNRLVLSFGVGVGSLSPSQYNGYVGYFNQHALDGPASGANVNTELHVQLPTLTYYAPYYLLIRAGAEAAYFSPSETVGSDQVTNYGGTLEIPIEFGGHYSFLSDKLIVEIAAGPAIAGFTSVGLSGSNGPTGERFFASPTVGFDSELRGQYFLSSVFSLGLEIGYRILDTGPLHTSDNANVIVNGNTVNLDMSGFRVELLLGFAII